MFGKKKTERSKPNRGNRSGNLSQFGLFDMPTNLNFDPNSPQETNVHETDSDLEEELLALTNDAGISDIKPPARRKAKITSNINMDVELDNPEAEENSDDESVDENDPELLSELNEITGTENENAQPKVVTSEQPSVLSSDIQQVLQSRLEMYKIAEQNAKTAGETSRARRFNRGIKQLEELIKQAKQGKAIVEDEIPPEVSTKPHVPHDNSNQDTSTSTPSRIAPPPPATPTDPPENNDTAILDPQEQEQNQDKTEDAKKPVNKELVEMLNSRKTEYKIAALNAKKSGDVKNAMNFIKVAKQFEIVIKAVEEGQEVDLSQMPGPPNPPEVHLEENKIQSGSENTEEETSENIPEPTLVSAGSLLEDLQQRLEIYQKQVEKAKEDGNSSKVRRMGRIVKQFEDAIKMHKNGKPVAIDELPTPPGYAPLSGGPASSNVAPLPQPPVLQPSRPAPAPSSSDNKINPKTGSNSAVRISGNHKTTTQADRQLKRLLERQKEFKVAALRAKQKGEIVEAKEYLRTAKGFDPLIEAAEGGLPVDFDSLPLPPTDKVNLDNEFEVVSAEEATEDDQGTLDILRNLEQQLTKQLKMCMETRDHNKSIGDVAGANRFENLALNVSKDLDMIRVARKTSRNEKSHLPVYHYEIKKFSIVKTFTDLRDNNLELMIVRGVNYNCSNPSEIDTFVKFEFPWPQDQPVQNKTSVRKNTNNPEYDTTFWLDIDRKARPCQRVFKRHGIKLEVYSKGGLFRGDSLLGSVTIKLQPLETQCEIHDSFDLMDGRKKVGGKLEVRVRIRDPLLTKQVEEKSEKWLIIDKV